MGVQQSLIRWSIFAVLCGRGPGIDKSLKATQEVDGDMFDCLVARRRSECRRPLEMIRDVTHQANSRHGAQTSKHQSEATDMARIHYRIDRKSTRLNSSHPSISYAVFCLKKKNKPTNYYK